MFRPRTLLLLALCLALSGCETNDALRRSYLKRLQPFLGAPVNPVVIIPGFANSRLFDPVTKQYVWGTPRNVIHLAYPDDLDLPIDPRTFEITPDRLVPQGTAGSRGPINVAWRLSQALVSEGGYPRDMIYVLDYDWRLDATDATRRLDALIERIRQERHDPNLRVDIVAHSAGGTVAMLYAAIGVGDLEDSASWNESAREASRKFRRMVLLASPQRGTAESFRVLVRGERFIRRDLSPMLASTFAFLVELLPFDSPLLVREDGSSVEGDLLDPATWRRLQLSIFRRETQERYLKTHTREELETIAGAFDRNLRRARSFRDALHHPPECRSCITVVAGDCVPTARRVLMRSDGTFAFYPSELRADEKRLASTLFEPGDGSIPESSAAVEKNPVLFCDGHQGIASDPQVHREIFRVLLGH